VELAVSELGWVVGAAARYSSAEWGKWKKLGLGRRSGPGLYRLINRGHLIRVGKFGFGARQFNMVGGV
jgi:hypothetical protein